jgi:hypothetical protein
MTEQGSATFPLDWHEWRRQWHQWRSENAERLQPTGYKFPSERNFMADEVLGVFHVNGRNVELSEVRFLDRRSVGVTYGEGSGTYVPESGGLFDNFADLEAELFGDES